MRAFACQCPGDDDCRCYPCVSAEHAGTPGISAEFYQRNAAGEVVGVLGDFGECLDCKLPARLPPLKGTTLVLYQRGRARSPLIVSHFVTCESRYTPEMRAATKRLHGMTLQPWQTATVNAPPAGLPGDSRRFENLVRKHGLQLDP